MVFFLKSKRFNLFFGPFKIKKIKFWVKTKHLPFYRKNNFLSGALGTNAKKKTLEIYLFLPEGFFVFFFTIFFFALGGWGCLGGPFLAPPPPRHLPYPIPNGQVRIIFYFLHVKEVTTSEGVYFIKIPASSVDRKLIESNWVVSGR